MRVAALGTTRRYRSIAVDLDSAEQALAFAEELAQRSGRRVTLRNVDGEVLGIFKGAAKN